MKPVNGRLYRCIRYAIGNSQDGSDPILLEKGADVLLLDQKHMKIPNVIHASRYDYMHKFYVLVPNGSLTELTWYTKSENAGEGERDFFFRFQEIIT